MSLPEYVFFERVKSFYEEIRTGQKIDKVDEILYFLDDKSLKITKQWLTDERFQWSIGKGWSMLTQSPPVVAMTLDNEQDHPGGQFINNYTGENYGYDESGNPEFYSQSYGRMKHGTYNFFILAPNPDMITTMYLLIQRALSEGESPTLENDNLRSFEYYGITELRYSGTDIRPDQSMAPTMTFGRTLSVSCAFLQQWSGTLYGKSGFVSSIDIGNVNILP